MYGNGDLCVYEGPKHRKMRKVRENGSVGSFGQ
jgi:hypothetical protein